ncbi:PEP-utilizing enzyme, partial [Chloroflexota bacterium]
GAARLDRGEALKCLAPVVPQRKAIWRAARRATPPTALPELKFLGIDVRALKAARASRRAGDALKGVAASPGRVTAPACVLHGPEDFSRMRAGEVLVAPLTTPAWTPLFARAAAVVTDIGGPLSHGSIVAREYGIPAVLGTGSATKRIRNGQIITVDGSAGQVVLSTNGGPAA